MWPIWKFTTEMCSVHPVWSTLPNNTDRGIYVFIVFLHYVFLEFAGILEDFTTHIIKFMFEVTQ